MSKATVAAMLEHTDTVLLDMDGALLDLHYDNHFWLCHLPQRFAEARGLPLETARQQLQGRYTALAGTLAWYSVDYWQNELQLDIMRLKEEVAHLIAVHAGVSDFLSALRAMGKRLVLATNAHHKSVTLKMARTGLEAHFDAIITSHSLGFAKEEQGFWRALQALEKFAPQRTMLLDDSLPVLNAARQFGIGQLLCVRRPDSQQPAKDTTPYAAIDSFVGLIQ